MRPLFKGSAICLGFLMFALVLVAPPATHADEWNLMTRFTVNHPFEIPGMTLQPNTPYVIRLHDSPSTRNVVQVLNDDETKMLTMFMAVSDERLEPADRTVFSFIETEPGYPLPIKEWFYPGRLNGLEFIYPKEQALEIARHAKEPILAAESVNLHDLSAIKVEAIGPIRETASPTTATAENVTKSELPPVEEAKPTPAPEPEPAPPVVEEQPQPTEEAPAIAENTQPEPPAVAPVEPAQQPAPEAPSTTEPTNTRELPRTAGELPLIALIGLLCLGAGLGLKVLKAKS
jgi:hypothetical protein